MHPCSCFPPHSLIKLKASSKKMPSMASPQPRAHGSSQTDPLDLRILLVSRARASQQVFGELPTKFLFQKPGGAVAIQRTPKRTPPVGWLGGLGVISPPPGIWTY